MLLHPLLIRGNRAPCLHQSSHQASTSTSTLRLTVARSSPTHLGDVAPFRLLSFGDPQLEGDTSLPSAPEVQFPTTYTFLDQLRQRDVSNLYFTLRSVWGSVKELSFYKLKYVQKKVDLLGNDFYLAHIYRTLHWWTNPTHVTVVGDLLGSQWIEDEEFEKRSLRYWQRVFRGGLRIPSSALDANSTGTYSPVSEVLGSNPEWKRRIFNVPRKPRRWLCWRSQGIPITTI